MTNLSGLGKGAICTTCHNSRNGEHADYAQNTTDYNSGKFIAPPALVSFLTPHSAAQADVVFGFNAYFMPRYSPSPHLAVADSCAGCHVKIATGSEAASMQTSNHSFAVDNTICSTCHGTGTNAVDGEALQAANGQQIEGLRSLLAQKMLATIDAACNFTPATGSMDVLVRPYDSATNSYSSSSSSWSPTATGWVSLDASGVGGGKNCPTSVGYTYTTTGSFLVVLNVPNPVTFTPTATGASPVTTSALAVSFTAIATNQLVPDTLPGWPAASKYYYSVWGPPSPKGGTTTPTYPAMPPLPGWQDAAGGDAVQTIMKAYWNISLLVNDSTSGIHNPAFFNNAIAATSVALKALP